MQTNLIASAGSEAQLLEMIRGYFYSPGIHFKDGELHNANGQNQKLSSDTERETLEI